MVWQNDKITLAMLKQIGVEGIVTALHDVPNGEVWTRERINELKTYIEQFGMRWSVVESLPVSESIKYAGPTAIGSSTITSSRCATFLLKAYTPFAITSCPCSIGLALTSTIPIPTAPPISISAFPNLPILTSTSSAGRMLQPIGKNGPRHGARHHE